MTSKNKKGIFWFLLLTFASTYIVEIFMLFKGYSFMGVPDLSAQIIVAVAMFFPGISAYIVRRFITKEGFKDAGMIKGKFKFYVQIYLLIPILFILIYGLTAVFIQPPDFTLQTFMKQYGISNLSAAPFVFILGIITASLTVAPFLNSIPAFGEEYGWRGYLLPKLLPLGTKKAFIITGIIWGLWHAPLMLMGYKYGSYGLAGIIFFTTLLMFIGIYVGYIRLASGSVVAAAFAHGVLNAQAYGIWTVIFPNVHPLLGGFSGLTGIFVFAVIGINILKRNQKSLKS